MTLTVQYIIIGLILSTAAVWIALKIKKKKEGNDSGCCGCGLYDSCKHKRNDCCSDDKQGRTTSTPQNNR